MWEQGDRASLTAGVSKVTWLPGSTLNPCLQIPHDDPEVETRAREDPG